MQLREGALLKRLLATVYCEGLQGRPPNLPSVASSLQLEHVEARMLISKAVDRSLVEERDGRLLLTKKGRSSIKVVMGGGVFDIIHPGHVATLQASKILGDVLVISVARDKTALSKRGKPLINDEEARRQLVSSIRYVDAAILGSEHDIYETVERVRPDIIALGYDQDHDAPSIEEESKRRGVIAKVVRLSAIVPAIKSSIIKMNGRKLEEL